MSWGKVQATENNDLEISFPNIRSVLKLLLPGYMYSSTSRWAALRTTEGWAALQYHAVLRGSLTLYPPQESPTSVSKPPHLLVELKRGSFFAFVPSTEGGVTSLESLVAEWYPGNIYDMERAVPATVSLPTTPSTNSPTKYDIFVSGDYEVCRTLQSNRQLMLAARSDSSEIHEHMAVKSLF